MYTTDKWKDYELIDCSDGEKLERWGNYILIRPDPQVIWKSKKKSPLWGKAHGVYRRSSSGGGSWTKKQTPDEWNISYGDLKFVIRPTGFKHTGLFPEQAANWDWFTQLIRNSNREIKILNLFAYTGGATVAAAAAGAAVCHVDASKGMTQQAKENARISGLENAKIRYIVDDCMKFIERENRRGNRYDAIIMDPPSYGRGPSGEVWRLEENITSLIQSSARLLSDKPLFFLLNSYTTGLSASTMGYLLSLELSKLGGIVEAQELGLPVTESGCLMPCGSAARCIFTR